MRSQPCEVPANGPAAGDESPLSQFGRHLDGAAGAFGGAVDATVVAIANAGDRIITGDLGGIRALVTASGRPILVVLC
jgi:hypothetical protein